jgi:hypothetical protein
MKRGPVIFLVAASAEFLFFAYPFLALEGRWLPDLTCLAVTDAFERIETAGRWYHDHKNLLTEAFRCDAQWWSKFTIFAIGTLLITNAATFVWAIVRGWR